MTKAEAKKIKAKVDASVSCWWCSQFFRQLIDAHTDKAKKVKRETGPAKTRRWMSDEQVEQMVDGVLTRVGGLSTDKAKGKRKKGRK